MGYTNSMKKKKYYIRKFPRWIIALGVFEIIYIVLQLQSSVIVKHSHYMPDYKMINLDTYVNKEHLYEADYKTLFYQTGLSPRAIDMLKNESDFSEKLKCYQRNFFADIDVKTDNNPFLTRTEYACNNSGQTISGFELAPLDKGYILYTPSSTTIGWQNGHIALVTDAEKQSIFEAFAPGTKSGLSPDNHWTTYPAFIMLKVKEHILSVDKQLIPNVVNTINSTLTDLPYSLFAGILSPKNPLEVECSQCAHILWYAFKSNGLDLDSNSGAIVTPSNIADCVLLEVVQIYGVDPDKFWYRVNCSDAATGN